MRAKLGMWAWLFATAAVCAGCLDVLGHQDRTLDPGLSSGGAGAAGGSGGATGGGGAMMCEAGVQQACYSGPAETRNVGLCKEGTQKCSADGAGFGACEGEVLPAQETCKDKADENCDGFDCALWSESFGDDKDQSIGGIGTDSAGNVYLTGTFQGTLKIGGDSLTSAGLNDVFVAKLDPSGKPIWAKAFGDAADQSTVRVAVSPTGEAVIVGKLGGTVDFGGGPLVSASDQDNFVVKLDTDGKLVWQRQLTGPSSLVILGIALDSAGNVLLAGGLTGTLDLGPDSVTSYFNTQDVMLVKLAGSTGDVSWAARYGGMDSEGAFAVTTDATNNVFVLGRFGASISFGSSDLTSSDGSDWFVAKFKPNGDNVWSHLIVTGGNLNFATSLAADSTGSVLVGGGFSGKLNAGGPIFDNPGMSDAYIVKIDSAGNHVWTRVYSSMGAENIRGLEADAQNGVLVSLALPDDDIDLGGGKLVAGGGADFAILRLDPSGNHVWSRRFGDAADQYAPAISLNASGELVLACGGYDGSIDFGSGVLKSNGKDIAVAKLAP